MAEPMMLEEARVEVMAIIAKVTNATENERFLLGKEVESDFHRAFTWLRARERREKEEVHK